MKFGLEAEKFLFDLKAQSPSQGVYRFLDGLTDLKGYVQGSKITNEFVLNMVEIGTTPSTSPVEVLKDYLLHYLMIRRVALREEVALVPLASLPMDYLPHMVPKWVYHMQNSILSGQKRANWKMDSSSPLLAAGNCAGIHVHAEIETSLEHLYSNRELMDKFNMGLMMTPMIAFSSSPYFFGRHESHSMRGKRYYFETYRDFPLNGQLPPVMESSSDVLKYNQQSIQHWLERSTVAGLRAEGLEEITKRKGANWNPVRWNKVWNTIEIRCLDSDSIELDCAKFIWVTSAMRRMDLRGTGLECEPLPTKLPLDLKMIAQAFEVKGNKVTTLPNHAIQELFRRAITLGTNDELVRAYLIRLRDFARVGLSKDEHQIFAVLERVLEKSESTADWILNETQRASVIDNDVAANLVELSILKQEGILRNLRSFAPEVFTKLEEMLPSI